MLSAALIPELTVIFHDSATNAALDLDAAVVHYRDATTVYAEAALMIN